MAELVFKYGPMKSGKTTDIIKTYYNYLEKDMKVLVFKPDIDKKGEEYIICRSGSKIKTDYLIKDDDNLYLLISQYIIDNNLDCVLIDEAQFLSKNQVDQIAMVVDELKIPVFCYGLRADAFTNLFPGSERLFAIADEIEELKAVCKCGEKATFNLRLEKYNDEYIPIFIGEQVSIDGIDSIYDSVCRKCYKKLEKKYK